MENNRYLETFYSRPKTYGGRDFVLVDYDKGIFTTGQSNSCRVSSQSCMTTREDLKQTELKNVVSRLLKSGLQEVNQEEYQALSINA
jgi:hypothetical protein